MRTVGRRVRRDGEHRGAGLRLRHHITRKHGTTVVATRNWVGKRTPLHARPAQVLLAYADGETLSEILGAGLTGSPIAP